MLTTPEEYRDHLWLIQNTNFPRKAVMPYATEVHDIDIRSREIDSPEYLSVLKDHKSENIYFSIKRYVDYIDLSETACVIQYKNKNGDTGIYPVPYYDLTSANEVGNERIIFPWLLDGTATAVSGPVEYAIRFFRIDGDTKQFVYSFNTLPAKSMVLYGLDVQDEDITGKYDIAPTPYDDLVARVAALAQQDMYWIEIK